MSEVRQVIVTNMINGNISIKKPHLGLNRQWQRFGQKMRIPFDILEEASIPAQYSLERYMKCALGVCGQCCVDSEGWRICVEGPVFENDKINQITEFGKYRRDASGVKY